MQLLSKQTTDITSPIYTHVGGKVTFQVNGVFGAATITLRQSLERTNPYVWETVAVFNATSQQSITIPYLNRMHFRASQTGSDGTTNLTLDAG